MKRVAITGVGLVSALGRGDAEHFQALRSGRTGLGALALFEAPEVPASAVGEVHVPLRESPWAGASRCQTLALTAAADALEDAGWVSPPRQEGALFLGTTTGGIHESERHYLRHRGEIGAVDRRLLRHHPAGAVADFLARALKLPGERQTLSTACSSSAHALGLAAMRVEAGLPWAVAGGVDSLCRLTFSGFHSLKLLSPFPCLPFDARRAGLSLAEGAAFLVLEREDLARARGARIWGRLTGWGCSADAHHITAPHPEGRGAASAIRAALEDAKRPPGEVGYVNAHGTATPANDFVEGLALQAVFGAEQPWVSSTKGHTGHTLGAAGALEAILTLLALDGDFLPSTVDLDSPDPKINVRHVARGGLSARAEVAVSNSFGFGGNNAALVLERAGER